MGVGPAMCHKPIMRCDCSRHGSRVSNASPYSLPIYFDLGRNYAAQKPRPRHHLLSSAIDSRSTPTLLGFRSLSPNRIQNMTTDNNTQTSPVSHPAKRVKLDEPNSTPTSITSTMAAPALLIKKLSDKARLPTRGSAFAAGYDIYASKATVIPARGKGLVDTDISMACPAGTCTFLFSSHHIEFVPEL